MSHDDNNQDLHTFIEPELEARVVAWVLGGASAFEAAEMERLTAEKPELAIFKRRIEAVHGLLGEATRADTIPLRLAPERRQKLLEALGATGDTGGAGGKGATTVVEGAAPARRKFMRRQAWMAAAACVSICLLLVSVLLPRLGRIRDSVPLAANIEYEREVWVPGEKGFSEGDGFVADELQIEAPQPASPPPASRSFGGKRVGQDDSVMLVVSSESELKSLPMRSSGRVDADMQLADRRGRIESRMVGGAGGMMPAGEPAPKVEFAATAGSSVDQSGMFRQAASKDKFDARLSQAKAMQEKEEGQANEETILFSAFEVAASDPFGDTMAQSLSGSRTNVKNLGRELRDAELADGLESNAPAPALEVKVLKKAREDVEEISATDEPVSTFSLHVSDVSFRLAQAALARGEVPDPETIRPEEFYNAFDYGDPAVAAAEKIACRIEQAAHPFLQQRNLVRIAMRVPAMGRGAGQPLRLTVLLDTSGSMEREDRAASLRRAIEVLASLLGPNDRVNLIGFARQPRLLVEQLPGDRAGQLVDLMARTPAEGGTNLEEALRLAGEMARRSHDAAAQNRIVLITDGAANLGNADPAQLAKRVETLRQQGVAFDACGVGTDGLDDAVLEALTRKGDGRYYVLDSAADADAGFARQLAGAFRPAAENVKVQVRFNPARVARYRLIGFEQHRLREEDFRNDAVDAAELAAEEAAVALYQIEALPEGEGELGEVYVRFRDAATGRMVERSWTMAFDPRARAFDVATPTMQLAGTAALLAEKLRGGEPADQVQLAELAPVVHALRGHYASDARVHAMVTMFEHMRRLTGE